MKIIIHSIEELLQLTELIRPPQVANITNTLDEADAIRSILRHESGKVTEHLRGTMLVSAETARQMGLAEPDGLPDDIAAPQAVEGGVAIAPHATGRTVDTPAGPVDANLAAALGIEDQAFPLCDSDGAPYSTDWHSDPKKLTAKNVWRAKRGRDEAAYKAWLREQAVEVAEAAVAADAEPVATETHALPQDVQKAADAVADMVAFVEAGSEPTAEAQIAEHVHDKAPAQPVSTVDLQALVAASQEAAKDAADGLPTLLVTCREFTSAHGTAEFNALKAAVAPRGDTGASLQEFTPAERRLMLACIADYPKKEA